MLNYAIVIFIVTAIGGLVLASKVLSGRLAPWFVSIIHAILGASGLGILIAIVIKGQGSESIAAALALLIVAALGGFILASYHVREKLPPKATVIIHAGVALAGFLTLLGFALGA